MATAGSRTSSSGIPESNNGITVGSASQDNSGSAGSQSSPGSTRIGGGESAQWRRRELRKVRSVDLDKPESLLLSPDSGAAHLRFLSASSPGSVHQQSQRIPGSGSLTGSPLSDNASNIVSDAQELLTTSLKNSADYGAAGTPEEVIAPQTRYGSYFE